MTTDLRPTPPEPALAPGQVAIPMGTALASALRLIGDPGALRFVVLGSDGGRAAEVLLARGAREVLLLDPSAESRAAAAGRLKRPLMVGTADILHQAGNFDLLQSLEHAGVLETDAVLHLGGPGIPPLSEGGLTFYREAHLLMPPGRGMLVLTIDGGTGETPGPLELAMHELFAAGFIVDGIGSALPDQVDRGPVSVRARARI